MKKISGELDEHLNIKGDLGDVSLAAKFSEDVYRDVDRPKLPEGWSLLCNAPDDYQIKQVSFCKSC